MALPSDYAEVKGSEGMDALREGRIPVIDEDLETLVLLADNPDGPTVVATFALGGSHAAHESFEADLDAEIRAGGGRPTEPIAGNPSNVYETGNRFILTDRADCYEVAITAGSLDDLTAASSGVGQR